MTENKEFRGDLITVSPKEVSNDLFKCEAVFSSNGKPYTLLEQQTYPWCVLQVWTVGKDEDFQTSVEAARKTGRTVIMEGRQDFLVMHCGGGKHVDITQDNHEEVYSAICRAMELGAQWWNQNSRKEVQA